MKPKKPNLLQRMKEAESAPRIQLEDVANLCVALRNGGLLTLTGENLTNAAASLARCESVCQKVLGQNQQAPATPPAVKPAEPSKG